MGVRRVHQDLVDRDVRVELRDLGPHVVEQAGADHHEIRRQEDDQVRAVVDDQRADCQRIHDPLRDPHVELAGDVDGLVGRDVS